jgi:LPXTG-motif cell wall-anchored protein
VPTTANNQCGNPPSKCIATVANSFCSTVLGKKVSTPPTTTVPKSTKVLGEKLVRTPSALPLTGAHVVQLLLAAATMLALGALLLATANRRRRA